MEAGRGYEDVGGVDAFAKLASVGVYDERRTSQVAQGVIGARQVQRIEYDLGVLTSTRLAVSFVLVLVACIPTGAFVGTRRLRALFAFACLTSVGTGDARLARIVTLQ